VLSNTQAQVALGRGDDRHLALRDAMTGLLSLDEPRRHIAGMISGLDVHYDLAPGGGSNAHPLVGRRIPDLDVDTARGATRIYALLHDARSVLLDFGPRPDPDIGLPHLDAWADRVQLIGATYLGAWELPVIGEVAAPPAALVRPDGHVAWTGQLTDAELAHVLTTWCGR
jgi:3-(3-hydroxy-phenyl)propionate hydroxylase